MKGWGTLTPRDGEEYLKEKRFIIVHIVIALIIQIIVLLGYYFKEKQTILAFPMLLGILMTISALVRMIQFGKRR